ncbi:MAG: Ig-like domain-containing protein [Pseudonocardiaceae bacterium]
MARLLLRVLIALAAGSALLLGGAANASPVGSLNFDAPPTATIAALDVTPPGRYAVASVTVETLKATVIPAATGSVQFMEDSTNIGAAVPVTGGGIASTKTTLPSGTHQLTAVFTPTDAMVFGSSTSNTVSYVVNAPSGANATVTTLRVFPTPVFQGIPVVLLANIAPVGAAGTIQFMDGTFALGAPVPATDGFTLLITPLAKGEHSLTVVFTPADQAAFVPSASLPVVLTVAPRF